MEQRPYYEQTDIENTQKLRKLLSSLPPFCGTFFRGIEQETSSRTRIAYAYDLRVFFEFLLKENPVYKDKDVRDITLSDLDRIKALDLEEYMEYLKYYSSGENTEHINKERGISRSFRPSRPFTTTFIKRKCSPRTRRLWYPFPSSTPRRSYGWTWTRVASLLDQVESGDAMTERQRTFHKKTRVRDLALMTLLLGTGLRVSECVGLDIRDVDFKNDGVRVHRKGGKEVVVYFGEEVREALLDYMEERKKKIPVSGHEQALFLSLQDKRMSVKSVENLVKKYARLVTPLKKITPHKLRSTYGTTLYQETGDIYLVGGRAGPFRCKHHQKALRGPGGAPQKERQKRRAPQGKAGVTADPEDEKTALNRWGKLF